MFSGKVTAWVSNQDFAYDGFYLQTANEKYLVNFAPRLGNQLTSAFRVGAEISVNAVEETSVAGKNIIRLVNITSNGMNIYNNPPILSVLTPVEEPIFGSSKIVQLLENKEGRINGFILSDKTILRIPPNAAEQLSKLAVEGVFVSYSGNQILRHGEFAPVHYTVVQCKTLTEDEKQYIIE